MTTAIDDHLRFDQHISNLCCEATMQLNALGQHQKYIGKPEKRAISWLSRVSLHHDISQDTKPRCWVESCIASWYWVQQIFNTTWHNNWACFENILNDFKMFFAFSSSFLDFHYTKIFLGKLWQSCKLLNFSSP